MNPTGNRIQSIDMMRGVAVVVMVMGHSIDSVLSLEFRSTELFRIYDFFRGFTAPAFLFVSGLTFSVATEKRWEDYRRLSAPLAKRLMRILLLFMIGYSLHVPFFSLDKVLNYTHPTEYAQLFQVDVLHCVAATLVVLHVLIFFVRSPARLSSLSLGLAFGVTLMTPIIWSRDLAPILSPILVPYFNQQQTSLFPLFPYSAFLLVGVAVGHQFLEARRASAEGVLFLNLARLTAILAAGCVLLDLIPGSFYPAHDFWKTSPVFFVIRLAVIILATCLCFFIRNAPHSLAEHLNTLGQASLLVYTSHIVVVYGSAANRGLAQLIGQTLPPYQAPLIGIAVLITMVVLVQIWNYLRSNHNIPARLVEASLAGALLVLFLVRPY